MSDLMRERLKAETDDPAVTVTDSHDGRVRELILGGSRGNLLTQRLVEEFRDAMRSAAKDRKLKLIVITGEKDHFSYGADVGEHLPEKIAEVQARAEALQLKQAELQAAIESLQRAAAQVQIVRGHLSKATTALRFARMVLGA